MKVLHIGFYCILFAALVGCSSMGLGSKRIDYKAGAQNVPSLELPPDLTAPASDDRYKIPGSEGESVTSYSDYSKGGATTAARSNGTVASAVLPDVKGVKLERNGTQRWLVAEGPAEKVWSVVKGFLQETGLSIKSEDQAAGIIETEWAENRAKIPTEGIRSVVGKVFDNLYSSGLRDQYRVRLERAKDGVSTEVYLTHKGMEEVLAADGNTSKWQARAADPEMEAEMLQRLMVRLGSTATQAAIAVADTGAKPATAAGGNGAASVQEIFDGSSIIVINDTFDKSWRRVGLAIEQTGWAVEDKDRAKGVYFLRAAKVESGWLDKLQFWKDAPNTNARYRVSVRDGGAACEVAVANQDGASDDASKKLLELVYKNINQ